jgi:mannose-6-phosphate isomerase-like protein (cupin superfamily)
VVKATAEITNGGKILVLSETQSTDTPLCQINRLADVGTTPLEAIEEQSGSRLGEDDILRVEDHLWRLKL